jgi:FkbM family methyltransferase
VRIPGVAEPLRLIAGRSDLITTELALNGYPSFEAETTEIFRALVRDSAVVLDIGANIGLYALLAALENPDAAVYGFEAAPAVYELFVANVEANGLRDRIEPIHSALADRDGEITLYVRPTGTPLSASTLEGFRENTVPTRVPAMRGDSFVDARGLHVDLIKIDTEATEPVVLDAMRETLERDRPIVICEVLMSRTHTALRELFDSLGYRASQITDEGLVDMPDIDRLGRSGSFRNFLFRPA